MNNYPWVPFFTELAQNISKNGREYLIDGVRRVTWRNNGKEHPLLKFGDEKIEPCSFIYALAQRNTTNQVKRVFASVQEVFSMETQPPSVVQTFPTPTPPTAALFHLRDIEPNKTESLWRLFRGAVDGDICAEDFAKVRTIKNVGVKKLTQTLFLTNPYCFLPFDDIYTSWSDYQLKDLEDQNGYRNYRSAMDQMLQKFPGCKPYEVDYFVRMQSAKRGQSDKPLITENSEFFQISTEVYGEGSDDYWDRSELNGDSRDFKNSSCVFTGGDGSKNRKIIYPLADAKRGDIVLVRTGLQLGRGIGVVRNNGYKQNNIGHKKNFWDEDSQIDVVWINKSEEELLGSTQIAGFNHVEKDSETYRLFKEKYASSFEIIERLISPTKPEPHTDTHIEKPPISSPLNVIFYGPPGTGKTYATRRRSVEICKNQQKDQGIIAKLYDELVKSGNIRFVTFHQSYGYEDFVEGLRPKLPSDTGGQTAGIQLEPVSGVLKDIAEDATERPHERFVLIIDEINRANVSKVMGELITLIEKDKRQGERYPVEVTLPYSKSKFTLPQNLYLLGTMNTADRSIAPLDIALRRRFEFEELPPEPQRLNDINLDESIDLQAMLRSINRRLEWFLDRDHLIGHAYFLDIESKEGLTKKERLDRIMRHKIIPLVAEYFYDDWNKVISVLGDGFIKREELEKPPDVDEGETRYTWSIQENFSTDAYTKIYANGRETENEDGSDAES